MSRVVKAVEGFFTAKVAPNASELSLFKQFEKVPATWREFRLQIDAKNAQTPIKVVYFVRHAQGTHNAADCAYGPGWWESEESCAKELLDPDLTPFGVQETQMKGPPSLQAELEKGMTPIERVVVSPLSRAIQTANTFFADFHVQNFLCLESCREVMDCYYFDQRRPVSLLQEKFPNVDFSYLKDEEDLLWTQKLHDETPKELEIRAQKFLTELFDKVPERHVVVVSHLCFLQALYIVATGERLDGIENCEVVPLVLTEK